jgi:hypothetical protein
MPLGYGGGQSLRRLLDRRWEGLLLLNPAQMLQGITVPE